MSATSNEIPYFQSFGADNIPGKLQIQNLHKALLFDRSNFFRAAFRSTFLESNTHVLNLPEDSKEAFDLFGHWIYCAILPPPITPNDIKTYILLYARAQKFCMESLCNQVMDKIKLFQKNARRLTGPSEVRLGYLITSPGCGLRRSLSDNMAYTFMGGGHGPVPRGTLELCAQAIDQVEDLTRDFLYS